MLGSVTVRNHLSTCIDAVIAGDAEAITRAANEAIVKAEDASELIAQVGLIAMHGDSDGHSILTLAAASMLCRWLISLRHTLSEDQQDLTRGLPLVTQSLMAVAPAVRAGKSAVHTYQEALFPSSLPKDEVVGTMMARAVFGHDAAMVERLLLGLYSTGADYRTIAIRMYDGIAQTFQDGGHSLLCAARGSQVLDAVEWSDDTPNFIQWVAPHLALHSEEPAWIEAVRSFLSDSQHSLGSYRTRLAFPKNEHALPLRALILSDAPTPRVCQGVYDALITDGASARSVGSVIALAAADLAQRIGDDDREAFVNISHGLLYASAVRMVYTQVQEVEALPLLFTAAAFINALHKEFSEPSTPPKAPLPTTAGGGLIAPALLETLRKQLEARDVAGSLATCRRYLQLGHDTHALLAIIGLSSAQADASADWGHTLQIVQAAGDEYLAWPKELTTPGGESFLNIAIRATALAKR